MSGLWTLTSQDLFFVTSHGITLVDFVASYCPIKASREHLLLEMVQHKEIPLNVVRVDLDANPYLVEMLQIMVLPTLLLFQDGILRRRHVGELTPRQLTEFVSRDLLPSPSGV